MKARKTPWAKKKSNSFSYYSFLGVLLIVGIFGYFLFLISRGAIEQQQLEKQGVITQARVIDEKNYFGNSPVSHRFSYSYEFLVNGKRHVGNTRDARCRVGDVVRIKYVPANPDYNIKLD